MERTLISSLSEHIGEEVVINGWIDVARDQGKMAFFDFRDRTGKVQGVVFGKPEVLEVAKLLRAEWVVAVTGNVNQRPEKDAQPHPRVDIRRRPSFNIVGLEGQKRRDIRLGARRAFFLCSRRIVSGLHVQQFLGGDSKRSLDARRHVRRGGDFPVQKIRDARPTDT